MSKRRLKIAFLVDRFGTRYGGAEAYGVGLMRELSKVCDITVFARDYDERCGMSLPYVSIRSWKRWPSWIRVLLFACKTAQKTASGFDIIHSHVNGWCGDVDVMHVTPVRYKWCLRPMPFWRALRYKISPRIQTYLALESARVTTRRAHRAVAVSEMLSDQFHEAYGKATTVVVLPPGVSQPPRVIKQQRQAVRGENGWSDSDQVCLLVARNPQKKGLSTILKAIEQLPAHIKLMVVGLNASTHDFVSQHINPTELGRVRLVEETSDVSAFYAAADLYLHPTINDSFGMAPLEAMSFGLPVILSPMPWCGFAQYVEHGQNALLLSSPNDIHGLVTSIENVCTNDALRAQLVSGGNELVQKFSWTDLAERYLELYDQILAERWHVSNPTTAANLFPGP